MVISNSFDEDNSQDKQSIKDGLFGYFQIIRHEDFL